jgi:Delta7-sterol 5-desaturase
MMSYLVGDKSFFSILVIVLLRYLTLASVAYFVFYGLKKRVWLYKKIQRIFPGQRDYLREVGYSILTSLIFAGIGFFVFLTPFVRYTRTYFTISQHSVSYFVLSIFVMILIHDTYFYWTHRLMHRKQIFRVVHRVHHLSTNPSPWAAMAFHPLEAIVEAGIIVVIPLLLPVHPLAIGLFLLFMMIYNVYGHLGYELYPAGFSRSVIGKWINTSVNHNMHHEIVRGNYGLYFLFWDRLMGTLHPAYDHNFDDVKNRTPSES